MTQQRPSPISVQIKIGQKFARFLSFHALLCYLHEVVAGFVQEPLFRKRYQSTTSNCPADHQRTVLGVLSAMVDERYGKSHRGTID